MSCRYRNSDSVLNLFSFALGVLAMKVSCQQSPLILFKESEAIIRPAHTEAYRVGTVRRKQDLRSFLDARMAYASVKGLTRLHYNDLSV